MWDITTRSQCHTRVAMNFSPRPWHDRRVRVRLCAGDRNEFVWRRRAVYLVVSARTTPVG